MRAVIIPLSSYCNPTGKVEVRVGGRCRISLPAAVLQQRACAQRGLAAIEFALVLSVFLIMMTGIVGVGALSWAQQTLTAAATEGARTVLDNSLRSVAAPVSGCDVAKDAASWMKGKVRCVVTTQVCAWTLANGTAAQCASVDLNYDTGDWPLLASMAALAAGFGGHWMPDTLSAHAIVQIQEPS